MSILKCVDEAGRCQSPFFEDTFLKKFNANFVDPSKSVKSPLVTFDFGELIWADLLELLSIVGAMHYLSIEQNKKVSFRMRHTSQSQKSIAHLTASGFFALLSNLHLGVKIPTISTTDPYGFFRFTNISDYYEKEEARKLISHNIDYYYRWMAPSQRLSFDKIVNEALENTLEHAYGASHRYVRPRMIAIRRFPSEFLTSNASRKIAQLSYWLRDLLRHSPGVDYLEITIVDVGVGILHRIREELTEYIQARIKSRKVLPSEINDLAALRFTLSGSKSTSSSIKEGKGYGLYKLKNHVQAWNGLFLIRTGRARLIYSPTTQEVDEKDNLRFFPGTQIRVMLPITDRRMNVEYILSRESELR
jgi:hypothetical protein